MGTVGSQSEALLTLHRRAHIHPIFNPAYAKENLVSLAETLVMLYFYFAILTLVLHYFVISGYIHTQTIPWLLIELSTANLLNRIPAELVVNKLAVALAVITTIVAAKLTKNSFEIIKADLHPKEYLHDLKTAAVAVKVEPRFVRTRKAVISPRATWK